MFSLTFLFQKQKKSSARGRALTRPEHERHKKEEKKRKKSAVQGVYCSK